MKKDYVLLTVSIIAACIYMAYATNYINTLKEDNRRYLDAATKSNDLTEKAIDLMLNSEEGWTDRYFNLVFNNVELRRKLEEKEKELNSRRLVKADVGNPTPRFASEWTTH